MGYLELQRGRRGDTYLYRIRLGSVTAGVTTWQLSVGVTANCQARDAKTGDLVLTFLAAAAPDAAGFWFLRASAATMRAVPADRYLFDFEVTYPDGVVQTVVAGPWVVDPDISRPPGAP